MNCVCKIVENVILQKKNSSKNFPYKYMAFPKTVEEVRNSIVYCLQNHLDYFVLGNASTIVLPSSFDGIIINMHFLNGMQKIGNTDIICYSGTTLENLAKFAKQNHLKGLEWVIYLPGTLGGAIYNNYGTKTECLFDFLKEIIVFHNGKMEIISKEKITYSNQKSFFQEKRQYVILGAHLHLKK